MNITRAAIKTIIAHAPDFDWSLQGFGMFRLYLSREVRLHVWSHRHATERVSTIHTHPWHFRSTVISGDITDRLYRDRGVAGNWNRQKIICGQGGCAVSEPDSVHLLVLQEITVRDGESYSLTADAIHESKPSDGCVTVIERQFLADTEHAYVFYPRGEKWVSAEPRPARQSEVEEMRELALSVWR
jgi:hypothetical protein